MSTPDQNVIKQMDITETVDTTFFPITQAFRESSVCDEFTLLIPKVQTVIIWCKISQVNVKVETCKMTKTNYFLILGCSMPLISKAFSSSVNGLIASKV